MQLESVNPANGTTIGFVDVTPVEEVPAAIAHARSALPAWRSLGAVERGRRIAAAGPTILARLEELARILTTEMGKPLEAARAEVRSCGEGLADEIGGIVEALRTEILEDSLTRTEIRRDPLGVCGAITPWNYPIAMPHWLVIPALVAGNTVVLKPSEETPLIADAWVRIVAAGLPDGVLQVVHGNEQQGKALVAGDVDLVAFTGSREAGAQILTAAGRELKRVLLELGGKDPLIVLEDADVARAARFAALNSFRNTGQVCVSTERIYVAEALHDAFVRAIVEEARSLRVGDGLLPGTDLGPMVHRRQKQHVLDQVRSAIGSGAHLTHGELDHPGCYLGPLVLTRVHHGMEIMRDETFGPVAAIQPFASVEEAIALANGSPYGLGAVVFGERGAGEVADRLDAGMIGINRGCDGIVGSPWVGAKQSGYGFHSGTHGHRQFAQVRVVSRPTSAILC